jgi:predicted DCC family thiol-disulfide oxidoreductase YuxK
MKIVFFDGVCNLCNFFVSRLLAIDKKEVLKFASLQGETAQANNLTLPTNPQAQSIHFLDDDGKLYVRSEAVLQIAMSLGFPWNLAGIAKVFPLFFRDFCYRFVALNRYKWFGANRSCRIPTESEKARFLP